MGGSLGNSAGIGGSPEDRGRFQDGDQGNASGLSGSGGGSAGPDSIDRAMDPFNFENWEFSNAGHGAPERPDGGAGGQVGSDGGHGGGAGSGAGEFGSSGEWRYRIGPRIGGGGFGVVYEAEQLSPVRRRVAIKIIKPGLDSQSVVARFEQERQHLAVMDHESIAKVYDGGVLPASMGSRPFFAMEYVRGDPLLTFCDRERLTIRQRLGVFVRVCEAIQHAHIKRVIHRDIKPGNVLAFFKSEDGARGIGVDGEGVGIKVIDFGVALALDDRGERRGVFTERGQAIGTFGYMSPEQAEMAGADVDTRTDVYSLGVLLYELLTGSLPFTLDELRYVAEEEIRRIIREKEPPRPSTRLRTQIGGDPSRASQVTAPRRTDLSTLASTLRGDLDWVVMRCLEKERFRRYSTARELGEDVERFLASEPVIARPASAAYRLRKFVRKHRGRVVGASVLALLLLGSVLVSGLFALEASRQRADAIEQRNDAVRQRAYREAVDDFFFERVFGSMDPDIAQGRALTLAEVVDDVGAELAVRGLSDPESEVMVLTWLGSIDRLLGRYGSAVDRLARASEIAGRTPGLDAEVRDRAEREHIRARVFASVAPDVTVSIAREHLARVSARDGAMSPASGLAHELLSEALRESGDGRGYRAENARAIEIFERLGPGHETDLAGVLAVEAVEALGASVDIELRRAAIALMDRAIVALVAGEGAEGSRRHAMLLTYKGRMLQTLEEPCAGECFEAAWGALTRALEMREAILRADHPEVAQSLSFLAAASVRAKEFARGEPYARRNVEIMRASDQPRQEVARAIVTLAQCLNGMEDPTRLEEILGLYEEGLGLYANGGSAVSILNARIGRGRTLSKLGRSDEASAELTNCEREARAMKRVDLLRFARGELAAHARRMGDEDAAVEWERPLNAPGSP